MQLTKKKKKNQFKAQLVQNGPNIPNESKWNEVD